MVFEQKGILSRVVDGKIGLDIPFQRIRRITGYLTGSVESWNSAKQSELKDRRAHSAVTTEDADEIYNGN